MRKKINARDLVGKRVSAGHGVDRDSGIVLEVLASDMVLVAWHTGVRTPCPIKIIDEVEDAPC